MSIKSWLEVKENYKLSLGLYKASFAFLEVSLGIGAGVIAIDPPASLEELKRTWPAFVFALATSIFRFLSNRRKHAVKGYYSCVGEQDTIRPSFIKEDK